MARRLPKVAVIGYPNVGKSTLVNRLSGTRETVTHAEPGVTRDRKEVPAEWNGVEFALVDTGGVDLADERDARRARSRSRRAWRSRDATPSLLVVDGTAGLRPGDAELAEMLRRAPGAGGGRRRTSSTAARTRPPAAEFHGLGLGEPLAGVGRARGRHRRPARPARRRSCASTRRSRRSRTPTTVRLAVIGRPNVGKSSLVNAFLGPGARDRERAGRDHARRDRHAARGGRPQLVLVDTAGLRRRSKVAGTVDYYAQLRSERAAERADVALVVCDAPRASRREDLRVADLAMRKGCATIVVLNKWDVTETDLEDAKAARRHEAAAAPARADGLGDDRPQRHAADHGGGRARRPRARPDPDRRAEPVRRRAAVRSASRRRCAAGGCGSTTRPRSRAARRAFAVYVNDRRLITRDYGYFLENRLRQRYRLEGVPLVIDFADRERAGTHGIPLAGGRAGA